MARNVEIKARLRHRAPVEKAAAQLSGSGGELLVQEDTFFRCATGRLKLRIADGRPAELIFYRRPDVAGPRTSDYSVVAVADGPGAKALLAAAVGVTGVVRKARRLYLVGQTRVHLDAVEGLGDFLELEYVLRPGQDPAEGEREVRALMAKLGCEPADLAEEAYVDMFGARAPEDPGF